MVYCVAVGVPTEQVYSFHTFPADEKLRRQWIARLSQDKYTWKEKYQLCSEHFRDEDFVISHTAARNLGFKPGTVPSVKLRGTEDGL